MDGVSILSDLSLERLLALQIQSESPANTSVDAGPFYSHQTTCQTKQSYQTVKVSCSFMAIGMMKGSKNKVFHLGCLSLYISTFPAIWIALFVRRYDQFPVLVLWKYILRFPHPLSSFRYIARAILLTTPYCSQDQDNKGK